MNWFGNLARAYAENLAERTRREARGKLATKYRETREKLRHLSEDVSALYWPWVQAATTREEARRRIIETPDHVTRCFMMDWFKREWPGEIC